MKVITAEGEEIDLGTVEATPTIGIIDFSRRVTDDFGITTVVERGFSRRMTVRLALPFDQVDTVQRRLAGLRATPVQWVADDRFAWLTVHGIYKDFELDLAVPPLSYCTLTVEGLAETEEGADAGGDPAPAGSVSSLLLLQPVTISDAMLVASNVAEVDYPEWAPGTAYALGARVIKAAAHRVYESALAGNVGHDPAAAEGQWIDVGPTNRWALFDQALGTLTTRNNGVALTLAPGAVDALALLDVVGSTVRVQTAGYDQTAAVGPGPLIFSGLPVDGGQVTVTVDGVGAVSVGTLLLGRLVALGITGESPTAGITDFSRKDVDDFGEVTVIQRAWAKRMTARALIRTDAVDQVANRIAAVRARPSLWIGDEGADSLTVYGFFKDFSIELGENVSILSLSLEGLSKAAPPPPPSTIAWPNVTDTDPANHPRPADGATNSADPSSPLGPDKTVGDVLEAIGDAAEGLDAAHQALQALTEADTPAEIITAAHAVVERARTALLAGWAAQLLQESRKARLDQLTHLDGVPIHTRVRQEIVDRSTADAAIVETVESIEAAFTTTVADLSATIVEEQTVRAAADEAETTQREAAISAVTALVDGETEARQAALLAERTTSATELAAETAEREAAISTVTGLVGAETAARQGAIVAERTTSATELAAETAQRESAISTVTGLIGDETAARQAAILTERTTSATELAAEAVLRQSLAATVGEHSVSITTLFEAVADASGGTAKGVLALNVDGHVVGIYVANDGTVGDIVFSFDSVSFVLPDGSPAMTIGSDADGPLVNAPRLKVGLLQVDTVATQNIKPGAVNNIVAGEASSVFNVPYYPVYPARHNGLEISITTTGGPVRVDQYYQASPPGNPEGNSTTPAGYMELVRVTGGVETVLFSALDSDGITFLPKPIVLDSPPAGTHVYRLRFSSVRGDIPNSSTWPVYDQFLMATEAKR